MYEMYSKAVALFVLSSVTLVFANNNVIKINELLLGGGYEFVDLTHPFDNHTVYWPNAQNFEFIRKVGAQGENGWYV
jgi:hypothetical protein